MNKAIQVAIIIVSLIALVGFQLFVDVQAKKGVFIGGLIVGGFKGVVVWLGMIEPIKKLCKGDKTK